MVKSKSLSLALAVLSIAIAEYFAVPIQKQNAKEAAFRKWLKEHMDDVISTMDLAKRFGGPQDLVEESFNKKRIIEDKKRTRQNIRNNGTTESEDNAYSDQFVRHKMFPMAAASYGTAENVEKCLRKTFQNATFYRNPVVKCDDKPNELCSAFTAISHEDRAIILSFRGTDSGMQLLQETTQIALFKSTESPKEGWGKVGTYFLKIFNQLVNEGKILDDLAKLLNTYEDYELWVTGHSLGGALAAIASANIVDSELISAQKLKLVTFGQPRTGDRDWAAAIDQNHHGTEIFYNNSMDASEEFVVCSEDAETSECADSYWYLNVRDHLYYFGKFVSEWGESGCAN
uniref:Fungal lipase-like domain-containing protein n=1 Tax=Globodera rostochiensis TaxID=31243 RepID=A0A914HUH0_GLORO